MPPQEGKGLVDGIGQILCFGAHGTSLISTCNKKVRPRDSAVGATSI